MRHMRFTGYCHVIGILLLAHNVSATEVQIKRFKAGDVIYAEDVNANFQALADTVKQLQTLVTDLEKRNKTLEEKNRALEAKIATLEKQIVAVSKSPQPASQTASGTTSKYRLRTEPKTIANYTEANKLWNLDEEHRPRKSFENNFEVRGDVVIDHATGLMWQKAGSSKEMTFTAAPNYLQQLNVGFAGYKDWRLPTIDELLSLIELEKQSNGLYISPVFDKQQTWCWSSDRLPWGAWIVSFVNGTIQTNSADGVNHVRAVRSLQP